MMNDPMNRYEGFRVTETGLRFCYGEIRWADYPSLANLNRASAINLAYDYLMLEANPPRYDPVRRKIV